MGYGEKKKGRRRREVERGAPAPCTHAHTRPPSTTSQESGKTPMKNEEGRTHTRLRREEVAGTRPPHLRTPTTQPTHTYAPSHGAHTASHTANQKKTSYQNRADPTQTKPKQNKQRQRRAPASQRSPRSSQLAAGAPSRNPTRDAPSQAGRANLATTTATGEEAVDSSPPPAP